MLDPKGGGKQAIGAPGPELWEGRAVCVELGLGRRGYTLPRGAVTMNGEAEAVCAWERRRAVVREETATPTRAGVASTVVTPSFLWQEAERSTDH